MTTISIISPAMVAHRGGCADVAKAVGKGKGSYHHSMNEQSDNVYEGETLKDAINAANDDLAAWFGEVAYQDDSTAWTVATCEIAPCLAKMLHAEKIGWDDAGRPIVKWIGTNPEPVPGTGTCQCNCGGSPKGKKSRFLPGHDAKAASARMRNPEGPKPGTVQPIEA